MCDIRKALSSHGAALFKSPGFTEHECIYPSAVEIPVSSRTILVGKLSTSRCSNDVSRPTLLTLGVALKGLFLPDLS